MKYSAAITLWGDTFEDGLCVSSCLYSVFIETVGLNLGTSDF